MGGPLRTCLFGVIVAAPIVIIVQACASFSSGECTDKALCAETDGALGPDTPKPDGNGGDGTIVDAPFDSIVIPDGPLPDGTCNGGAEDCTNDKDDNCNGLVDCADPVCTGGGYSCAEPPPPGWQGPMTLQEALSPAACAAPYAQPGTDAHSGLNAGAASCSCSCPNPATGELCNLGANVTVYTGSGCSTSCSTFGLPGGGFCFGGLNCAGGTYSVSATPPSPSGGSCTPVSSTMVPAITWSLNPRTCLYSGPADPGGCMGGATCVGKPPAPFGGVCVSQAGDVACPGAYPTKHLYYGGVSDSRSCTMCNCNSPSGGTCNAGTLAYWTDPGCSTALTTSAYGGCVNFSAVGNIHGVNTGAFSLGKAGTCTSTGGAPQGSATGANPTTVCCK